MRARFAFLVFLAACPAPPPADGDAGPEPGTDAGADAGTPDAGALPGCAEDNAEASVAARDGFLEACVDGGAFPRARCGDGSPLKLAFRGGADGGQALLLYFRGTGRCDDYLGCWGRDGKGGEDRTVAGLSNTARTSPPVSQFSRRAFGLFDRGEPGNPLAAFAVVHVPDCTGDLGARDQTVDLARPANAALGAPASLRTFFTGAPDVEAAVAMAQERFGQAARVVLVGTGEGAWFALKALPRVDAAWPAPASLAVLFDGEVGVGRPELEAKVRAALAAYDGQQGRRLVRFAQVGFASDPLQRAGAPVGFDTSASFQAALREALSAREAAAPASYRAFTVPLACHQVAMSPGLFQQFVPWTGGLRPQQPAARPNPDLTLDGGALESWLAEVVSGDGPFDAGFASRAGDLGPASTECPLPGSLEP